MTAFMGVQSLMAYSMIAWLPTIYRDRGVDAAAAGLLLTALSLTSVVTALTVPSVATRLPRQSALAVAVVLPTVAGLAGCCPLQIPGRCCGPCCSDSAKVGSCPWL